MGPYRDIYLVAGEELAADHVLCILVKILFRFW